MIHEFDCGLKIIKPLKKIWCHGKYSKFNTVVVDNTPHTFSRNYGNAITAKDYNGQEDDIELERILNIIQKIAKEENVREGLRKARDGLI